MTALLVVITVGLLLVAFALYALDRGRRGPAGWFAALVTVLVLIGAAWATVAAVIDLVSGRG